MSESIRELIAGVPSPGSDHREDEPPTLLEQGLVDIGIVRADVVRHVRNIELDGPTATRFQVDEERTVRCAEDVAGMGFAMQQLLFGAAAADLAAPALQRAQEEIPVGLSERGCLVPVRDQLLSFFDAFQEVRRRDLDASHACVQTMQRVGVGGR